MYPLKRRRGLMNETKVLRQFYSRYMLFGIKLLKTQAKKESIQRDELRGVLQ